MPLIKARTNRVPVVRHICRLQEPNRSALVLYARFIGDTVDYVLNQLIATTLAKDRDFVDVARGAARADADREARRRVGPARPSAARVPTPRDGGADADRAASTASC